MSRPSQLLTNISAVATAQPINKISELIKRLRELQEAFSSGVSLQSDLVSTRKLDYVALHSKSMSSDREGTSISFTAM
jgi:hypothetical protein